MPITTRQQMNKLVTIRPIVATTTLIPPIVPVRRQRRRGDNNLEPPNAFSSNRLDVADSPDKRHLLWKARKSRLLEIKSNKIPPLGQ